MISVIVVVKAFDNNQWPFNLFIIHIDTTRLKQYVMTSTIAYALGL